MPESPANPLGIGIIGAGSFGAMHAEAIATLDAVRLVAAMRTDPVALAAFGMLVGLSPIDRRTGDFRLLRVASLAAAVAAAVVAAGFGLLTVASPAAIPRPRGCATG